MRRGKGALRSDQRQDTESRISMQETLGSCVLDVAFGVKI